jgi:integrase
MEKMPGHPRLYRRGATYYHRAAIPVDIKDSYPKAEETFSLRTKDYQEAVRRVRVAAAEVDRKFEEHRRQKAQQAKPPLKELSDAEIKRIGEVYYSFRLEEDEGSRLLGFYEEDGPLPDDPLPTFEEYVELHEAMQSDTRHDFARGKVDLFFASEAEEVLTWDNIDIRLDPASPSWRKLARELQAASIKAAQVIKQRNEGDVVETPRTHGLERQSQTPLLAVAVEDWAEEKSRTSWVPKTKHEHLTWMGHFIAVTGNRPIDAYTKADARAFKGILLKLPANWNKNVELHGLPLDKAAAKADKIGLKPMSDSNVNKLLGFVGSFWNWASKQYDEASVSPFSGLKITQRKRVRDERDPFTVDELRAIFSAPLYTGCKSISHWQKPGGVIPRDSGLYWVPLISLYTGARLGEIIQLYVEDVREENDILFFDINDHGDDKRIKTSYSERSVPIHKHLLEIGFMDLVEKRRRQGQKRLFPDLPMGEDGYYSSPFSKKFSRFLEAVGIKHKKNAFHSFRHSFEDACRDSDIPTEIMDALQGHGPEGMSKRYGRGYYLRKLSEAMERIQFRDLDLGHLMYNE